MRTAWVYAADTMAVWCTACDCSAVRMWVSLAALPHVPAEQHCMLALAFGGVH
jgi:hypothetical protein